MPAVGSFVTWGGGKGVWRSASRTESRGNNYCLTSVVACLLGGLEIKSLEKHEMEMTMSTQ